MNRARVADAVVMILLVVSAFMIVGIIVAVMYGTGADHGAPALCPSEPDDAWIQRRLSYFKETCGPLPFDVKIWKKGNEEGIEGHCARPDQVKRFYFPPQGGPLREGIAPNKEL